MSHAEFASLFRAWVANGQKLPKKLAMDVDRMFCQGLEGNCYKYLNLVLEEFGVEELYVRNGSGKVFKLTPTSSAAPISDALETMSISDWEKFTEQLYGG